jgi:hypothetical protein
MRVLRKMKGCKLLTATGVVPLPLSLSLNLASKIKIKNQIDLLINAALAALV